MYGFVVMPSAAVTTIAIGFGPTIRLIDPEGVPEVTGLLFTLIDAAASAAVGVTVRLFTAFPTD